MSPANQSYAIAREESQTDTFFRLLFHDDRNSRYFISTDSGGQWSDTPLFSNQLSGFPFNDSSNYYITHNGFTGRQRRTERTRQLNALFFDVDCHGLPSTDCRRAVEQALSCIDGAVSSGRLPKPTLTVHSGRGIHLYYVLQRSVPYRFNGSGDLNDKGLSYFRHLQNQLADVLEEVLDAISGIDVDRAVFDHTRVSRIPGTYNAKAGTTARLVNANETFYSLADLAPYKATVPALPLPAKKTATLLSFHPLMMSRLNKIAELQEYRGYDCEGTREKMCFVYYNTAVQIYRKEDARQRLQAFNQRFRKPLPASELAGIYKAVDDVVNVKGEKGYYHLKAETLIRFLALTRKEMDDLYFFSSKRMVERMEAKRKTAEKRRARNTAIVECYRRGDCTQKDVAEQIGCSLRTVQMVLKEAGLTRSYAPAKAPRRLHAPRSPLINWNYDVSGVKSASSILKCAKKCPTGLRCDEPAPLSPCFFLPAAGLSCCGFSSPPPWLSLQAQNPVLWPVLRRFFRLSG